MISGKCLAGVLLNSKGDTIVEKEHNSANFSTFIISKYRLLIYARSNYLIERINVILVYKKE